MKSYRRSRSPLTHTFSHPLTHTHTILRSTAKWLYLRRNSILPLCKWDAAVDDIYTYESPKKPPVKVFGLWAETGRIEEKLRCDKYKKSKPDEGKKTDTILSIHFIRRSIPVASQFQDNY